MCTNDYEHQFKPGFFYLILEMGSVIPKLSKSG